MLYSFFQTTKQQQANEIDGMKETFALLDSYGDGSIAMEEMGLVLRSLGHCPSEAQIKELQQAAQESDDNETGRITFPEFLSLFTSFKKLIPTNVNHAEDMKAAFQMIDQDGDDKISEEHFRRILSNCGEKLEVDEVDDILQDARVDGKGLINYEEFIKTFLSRKDS
ncbi:calmodulin-A-like [Ylistrum balloti]|uniref:calmodulin-A-like n=1 Tax=Ylistrum balloti TaxID=509963 RepID=UPI002905C117|nr:calmodulin-A-like [Ylistrum balloti]